MCNVSGSRVRPAPLPRAGSNIRVRVQGPKQILVVTDGETMPSEDDFGTMSEQVAPHVKENEIHVSLLGIDPSSELLTDPQQQNLKLFEHIAAKESVMAVQSKIDELSKPEVKPVGVISKFRGHLIFGSDEEGGCGSKVLLKIWAFALAVEKKFSSATKIIGRSKIPSEVGTKAMIDREYMYKHPEIGTEEENERFEKTDLQKTYNYGREAVPFNEFDEQNLKLDPGPKSMHVSGGAQCRQPADSVCSAGSGPGRSRQGGKTFVYGSSGCDCT